MRDLLDRFRCRIGCVSLIIQLGRISHSGSVLSEVAEQACEALEEQREREKQG